MFSLKRHSPRTSLTDLSPESAATSQYDAPASSRLSSRGVLSVVKGTWMSFSDWMIEWSPMVLVVCYWLTCTAIYCMLSPKAVEVFYYFYMVANLYISLNTALEAWLGLSPVRDAAIAANKVDANGGKFPSADEDLPMLDMVMVAYLPNEKDIVWGQVMYALEELAYPKHKLRINLVYNTPKPIEPLESRLHQLAQEYRQLRVISVPNSTSKADNLNYFLSSDYNTADYIGIFDTDHLPHPYNPRWAAERFVKDKVDIVQGRCVVYNTNESFQAKMIAIEFDKIYAISHPGRQRLTGFGLFCGSNGWWKSDVLGRLRMHGDMLTEDIDSALRAYGNGYNAVHDMNVLSYELAPNTAQAFWKQRMRWTQGWTQASIVHFKLIWTNPPNGKRSMAERFGLLSLLFIREMSYYLVSQHTCLLASFIIIDFPKNPAGLASLVFYRYAMAQWFLFAMIAALIATLWFTNNVRSEFTSWRSMLAFSILFTPYLILQSTMGLYGHARELVKYSSWNPTART